MYIRDDHGIFMGTSLFAGVAFEFSVGIGGFVIGLGQISFFFFLFIFILSLVIRRSQTHCLIILKLDLLVLRFISTW